VAWNNLPLPAGGSSPAVIEGGAYGAGWYLAGFQTVGTASRRWVVLGGTSAAPTAVDLGAGDLAAATPAASGGDFLLAGGASFSRVTAAGRAVADVKLKVEAGADLSAVVPLGDGALVVGTFNPFKAKETSGWLVALDARGKQRWEVRLGAGAYHLLLGAAVDRRGHVIAVGASKKSGVYNAWVVDVDQDGKLAAERELPSKTWDLLTGVTVVGDEELYVTGKSSAYQDADGTAVVARRTSVGAETWRHTVLESVLMVGKPVFHRDTVELLVTTARGQNGTLHLVRAPRAGAKPTTRTVAADAFPIDWLALPAWIVGTSDTDTSVLQVRRGADGGVQWRLIKVPRR
jgi:hypothetical protein